jgi:hypothetical protein
VSGATPDYEQIEQAEAVAVRAALERGYLDTQQLREALLLREQLRVSGRPTRLLQLLGARYIRPEHQAELSGVYFAALGALSGEEPTDPDRAPSAEALAATPPAADAGVEDMMMSSADELAIPEFMLQQSSAQLDRPPEEDPEPVRDFLAMSGEGSVEPLPPAGEEVSESGMWRWLKRQLPGSG